ncbi:hypothetical protein BOTBODRAFT_121986, partial [Botryobasidium botryosum FD-172 SS1]
GKLHLGVDGWSSPNTISFLGITLHFQHEGAMRRLILDFILQVFALAFLSLIKC